MNATTIPETPIPSHRKPDILDIIREEREMDMLNRLSKNCEVETGYSPSLNYLTNMFNDFNQIFSPNKTK